MADKIDVHHHIVPPCFRAAVARAGGDPAGVPVPDWSEDAALASMDALGIAKAYVSVTAPGAKIVAGDAAASRALAREMNEFAAELVKRHPARFGFFASLPDLVDVEGALAEIEHAHGWLKASGFTLFTSYGEDARAPRYLGHPCYDPLWRRLNELGATVFVHPCEAPTNILSEVMPQPGLDYPHETARTAVSLVTSGTKAKYPHVKVILSHGGGTLAVLADRAAGMAQMMGCPLSPQEIIDGFRTFYYDVALTAAPAAVAAVLELADPARLLYGSDLPYAPEATVAMVDAVREDYLQGRGKRIEGAGPGVEARGQGGEQGGEARGQGGQQDLDLLQRIYYGNSREFFRSAGHLRSSVL